MRAWLACGGVLMRSLGGVSGDRNPIVLVAAGALGHQRCTTASCCRTSSGNDLRDVIDELRSFGYLLELDVVLRLHLAFRFPLLGDFAAAGVEVELRGRSNPGTCSARRTRRPAAPCATSTRPSSACKSRPSGHGRRAPHARPATAAACRCIRPARPRRDSWSAGVRYRAWQLPSGAAPDDRRARVPLVFDLVEHLDEPALARRLPVPRLRIRAGVQATTDLS